jgi:hypothetical protein
MLAGLVIIGILKTPPDFSTWAGATPKVAVSKAAVASAARKTRFTSLLAS